MIDNKIINDIVSNFDSKGKIFMEGKRNTIKIFDYQGIKINVKSFKKPSFVKKIVYKYFRFSKAKRSFANANYLITNNFCTPKPIAFHENFDFIGLKNSYYLSEHLQEVVTIGTIFYDKNYPNWEQIIKAYTKYFFALHEKGIEFLDNSLGNTLLITENNEYKFYLVDLNRMNIDKKMTIDERMKNFSRLTLDGDVLRIIATEYARLNSITDSEKLFHLLIKKTHKFHYGLARKKNLKRLRFFNLNDLSILAK
jgi:hypothetical protein